MRNQMKRLLANTFKGAGILAIAGFISKILAALYRFPYQNLVGDQGFYAFQQVYPFYSIITTLSLVALPNFLSSLIHRSDEPELETQQFFQLSLLLSFASFVILTIFSQPIAKLMGQEKLAAPLVMAISPLLLVPFLSLYRGLLQGRHQMGKTAVSQIIEQLFRVVLIILAAASFLKFSPNIYTVSFLAMLGSFVGGLCSLVYLIITTPLQLKELFTNFFLLTAKLNIIKKFGISSLIFTFFMIYMLLLQMIDVFFVKHALMNMSQPMTSNAAEKLKGVYDRGQPFLQLGLVITTSILTDALPRLSKKGHIPKKIWHVVILLSVTITTGLFILLPTMNDILFQNHSHALSLQIFILQIPLISMIQLYHHALFLKHKNKASGCILLVGLCLKLLTVYPLTVAYGILGASLSSLFSLLVVALLYMCYSKIHPLALLTKRFYVALLAMSLVLIIGDNSIVVENRLLQLLKVILLSAIAAAVFLKISKFELKQLKKS